MLKIRPLEKLNASGARTRRMLPSLCCLPALIEEIDGMDHEPVGVELAYLIARYKKIEVGLCAKSNQELAPKMVNEYLMDVLWRTRGDRHPEKAKSDPANWPRMDRQRKTGSGIYERTVTEDDRTHQV